ncbi:MAG: ROK family protein [Bacteroidales bacterium]|nr:ROK family protein [Bacteroidales bacterium]
MNTIGIDLGGTNIRAARILPGGEIDGYTASLPTDAMTATGEEIYSRIVRLVEGTRNRSTAAIGIGSTGPIDIDRGMTLDCNNLPSMQYFPICKRLSEDTGLPVFLNNDANALILGEAAAGAGKGYDRVLGLTIGTGLGAALVVSLKVVRGAADNAGEIWTAPYRDGIIEDWVSGTGIQRMYEKLTGISRSGKEIADLARRSDPDACKVWKEFALALGFALSWTVNMDDPDIVVLGGSVIQSSDLFLEEAETFMRRFICDSTSKKLRIAKAALGGDAGVVGAGIDAHRRL